MATTISGDGVITLGGTTTTQGEVRLYEDTDNGTNYVSLQAPASISSNTTFTLPNNAGSSGQVLTSDGAGGLSFATPDAGFSGATDAGAITGPVTLTSSSTQTQIIRITSAAQANNIVNLPNATTMSTEGGPAFIIVNLSQTGSPLYIKNASGTLLATLNTLYIAYITLQDNSTSAGAWQISKSNISTVPLEVDTESNTSATLQSGSNFYFSWQSPSLLQWDDDHVIAFWMRSTAGTTSATYLQCVLGTADAGGALTWGALKTSPSKASLDPSDGLVVKNLIKLNSTTFVAQVAFTVGNYGQNSIIAGVVDFGADTVTFSSWNNYNSPTSSSYSGTAAAAGANGQICRVNDTTVATVYNTNNGSNNTNVDYPGFHHTGNLACTILTLSGTTWTTGTAVNLTTVIGAPYQVTRVSDSGVVVIYCDQTAELSGVGRRKANYIGISGTTPTWGATLTIDASDIALPQPGAYYYYNGFRGSCLIDTDKIAALTGTGGAPNTIVLSLSGTTLSVAGSGPTYPANEYGPFWNPSNSLTNAFYQYGYMQNEDPDVVRSRKYGVSSVDIPYTSATFGNAMIPYTGSPYGQFAPGLTLDNYTPTRLFYWQASYTAFGANTTMIFRTTEASWYPL